MIPSEFEPMPRRAGRGVSSHIEPHALRYIRHDQITDNFWCDDEIMAMWAASWDTKQIAAALGIPEAVVSSRVPRIIERRRLLRTRKSNAA